MTTTRAETRAFNRGYRAGLKDAADQFRTVVTSIVERIDQLIEEEDQRETLPAMVPDDRFLAEMHQIRDEFRGRLPSASEWLRDLGLAVDVEAQAAMVTVDESEVRR
jgi:hypothetical protein